MPNPFFSVQGPSGQTRPDNLKVTKSALRFGPLEVTRGNTVPPMDHGRPGDVILIDNTDSPSQVLQVNQTPTSVGLWMKLPLSYPNVPAGNTVIGFPVGVSSSGDVLRINTILVPMVPPYTAAAAATAINAASIPNIVAQVVGEALVVSETTGGAITITDQVGSASVRLGIYSQKSIADLVNVERRVVNGVWMPVGAVAASGGPSAPTAASYLTLGPNPSLPDARTLASGVGVDLVDTGPGGTLTIQHDIAGVAPLMEPLVPTDELLIHNVSTGQVERISVADIATASGGVAVTEAVQQRTTVMGTAATYPVGPIVPAGALVRSIILEIASAYSPGTIIEIGDAGDPDRLMRAIENDPTEVNRFETTTLFDYLVATQIVVTIGGFPVAGASRVIVDFVVP